MISSLNNFHCYCHNSASRIIGIVGILYTYEGFHKDHVHSTHRVGQQLANTTGRSIFLIVVLFVLW